MNLFFAVIFVLFSLIFYVEGSNDTYANVYKQQKKNIDAFVNGNITQDTVYLGILYAFNEVTTGGGIVFDQAELDTFMGFLKDVQNFTEDKSYSDEEFTDLMDEIQMVMVLTTPTLYEAIRFKDIEGLGTLQNIFSMGVENAFVDAWSLIKNSTTNGSCQAYDQMLQAVTDTPAEDYIRDVFVPELCTVSNETMEKWHLIFDQIDPLKRVYLVIQEYLNGLPVFVFAKIAKAFRPAVYKRQFEKYVYTYPIIIAIDRAIESTAFTKDEKKMLQVLATEMREQLPLLAGPEEREAFTSTKFAEIVSDNPSFLKTFAKVKLINDDANLYDLIMWITQSANLEAMYNDLLNNRGISLFTRHHVSFFSLSSFLPKPCTICNFAMENVVLVLKNNENNIHMAIGELCLNASRKAKYFAKALAWACETFLDGIADGITAALAKGTSDGEICKNIESLKC